MNKFYCKKIKHIDDNEYIITWQQMQESLMRNKEANVVFSFKDEEI